MSSEARTVLLDVAREAVSRGVEGGARWRLDGSNYTETIRQFRACFVTLHREGHLRGCVGSLRARLPLVEETARSAHAAAFEDPRFPAVSRDELHGLEYQISVLGPAACIVARSEVDLLAQLRPGIDGLILRDGGHSGTFLPDVWKTLPNPADFLRQLRLKAGLPADHWSATIEFSRYSTESFGDGD